MNLFELTHAYQDLAAQASLDKSWAKTVESSITDHALWLDRRSQAGDAIVHQVEQRLKRQFDATAATAQASQGDTTDAALRAHVQAHDAAVTARLDKAEAALHASLSALDVGLKAHTQEAVEATQHAVEGLSERTHLLETARGLSGSHTTLPTGVGANKTRWSGHSVSG